MPAVACRGVAGAIPPPVGPGAEPAVTRAVRRRAARTLSRQRCAWSDLEHAEEGARQGALQPDRENRGLGNDDLQLGDGVERSVADGLPPEKREDESGQAEDEQDQPEHDTALQGDLVEDAVERRVAGEESPTRSVLLREDGEEHGLEADDQKREKTTRESTPRTAPPMRTVVSSTTNPVAMETARSQPWIEE